MTSIRRAIIRFLQWVSRQHGCVQFLVLMVIIFPVGIPVALCPPFGDWWDRLVTEAFPP